MFALSHTTHPQNATLSIREVLTHKLLTELPELVRLDLVLSIRLDGFDVGICYVAVLQIVSVVP